MSWFKVDDRLYSHPKWMATPHRARALWVTAGSWCAAEMTDGKVPRHALALLGGTPKDAAALVAAGLWRELKTGWIFHEWTIYQPDAASERAKRKADSDAGILGNHRRWHVKRKTIVPDCPYCNGVSEDEPPLSPEEEETYRGGDRVPDRGGDGFSIGSPIGSASLVPVPDTHSDKKVGGGGYVSSAQEPPPPPTPDILDNMLEPWRCPDHQGTDSPCNQCKRYKAAWKALEAERAKETKAASRRAAENARAAERAAEDAERQSVDPDAARKAAEAAKAALRAARSTPGSEPIKDKGLTARMEDE